MSEAMNYAQLSKEVDNYFKLERKLNSVAERRGIPIPLDIHSYFDPRLMNLLEANAEQQERAKIEAWKIHEPQRLQRRSFWIGKLGATTYKDELIKVTNPPQEKSRF
jgi:hypothetical protein